MFEMDVDSSFLAQTSSSSNSTSAHRHLRTLSDEIDSSSSNLFGDEKSTNNLQSNTELISQSMTSREPDSDSIKMFVGQIPRTMKETDLIQMFNEYGSIYQLNILKDKRTGESKGCCFITFHTRKAALDAQNALHNLKTLPGMHHPIQMKPADTENRNERKLFVGMINRNYAENDVKNMFLSYGPIEDCTVLRDMNNKSRGCAFVTFRNRQSAINAIKGMHHSQTMDGCSSPIVVKFADTPKDKEQRKSQQVHDNMPLDLINPKNPLNRSQFGSVATNAHLGINKNQSPIKPPMQPSGSSHLHLMNTQFANKPNAANINQLSQKLNNSLNLNMAQANSANSNNTNTNVSLNNPFTNNMASNQQQTAPNQAPGPNLNNLFLLNQLLNSSMSQFHVGSSPYPTTSNFLSKNPIDSKLNASGNGNNQNFQNLSKLFQTPNDKANFMLSNFNHQLNKKPLNQSTTGANSTVNSMASANTSANLAATFNTPTNFDLSHLASMNLTKPSNTSTNNINSLISNLNTSNQGANSLLTVNTSPLPNNVNNSLDAFMNNKMNPITSSFNLSYPNTIGNYNNNNNNNSLSEKNKASSKQIEGPDGCNLFIYHLPSQFTDFELAQAFMPFGRILSAKVFIDKKTNLSKCFGFVSYDNHLSASNAIKAMNGFQIGIKRLKVQVKKSKQLSAMSQERAPHS